MKTRDPLRRGKGAQSAAQRQGSLAMVQVIKAWEDLSDPQRERSRREGKQRRTTGISYFKHINLRQGLDGMAWAFEQVRAMVPEAEGWGRKKA